MPRLLLMYIHTFLLLQTWALATHIRNKGGSCPSLVMRISFLQQFAVLACETLLLAAGWCTSMQTPNMIPT